MPYSRLWAESLDPTMKTRTYDDFIRYGLQQVREVYGSELTTCVAFKEVWTNEMGPAFCRSYPNGKVIFVIRDPRGVTASSNVTREKYPVIFLARQWRKLSFLARYTQALFPTRVLILCYESLVREFARHVEEIAAFLGLRDVGGMGNPRNYRDGENRQWAQNTAYEKTAEPTIEGKYVDKWRDVLEEADLALIDLVCLDWMREFGYGTSRSVEDLLGAQAAGFRRWPSEELACWIRPHSFDDDLSTFSAEIEREKARLDLLHSKRQLGRSERTALQIWS